ncbi:Uncharacterized protein PECH_003280 [Penicillium ucsense]|uniref:Septin-type G domain-containing protein n=1 Tax=Penicillium ucsense TaxID=2839758 RepID=A0A8J8VWA3_9EURO|nr:Uncharacterized protein PECM_002734 [Penicillium ucsense]KAF7729691.1 Uncharacterized protein PECH_003280 [Penicillium ucsense]
MRPVPDMSPLPRKHSADLPSSSSTLDPRSAAPATFFLSRNPYADEEDRSPSPDAPGEVKESMYGVQSLTESLGQPEIPTSPQSVPSAFSQRTRSSSSGSDSPQETRCSRRRSTIIQLGQREIRDSSTQPPSSEILSRPLTPFHPDEPLSLPSSPKSISNRSLRHLDDVSITEEINSQAMASGDEEEDQTRPSPRLGFVGASQLIMPSIKMPSRRPFTERGKAMGRFKVLVAGAPGSGKTSLIKAIVQICEDIVHVDSIDGPSSVNPLERRRAARLHSGPVPTRGMPTSITEIYASTKPYPPWWSDLEDSRVLRRRKSIGEIVLERNLCFVDTASTALSQAGQTHSILQYMRQQLQRAALAGSGSGSDVDFQNLLAGNGGTQVDLVLYLIAQDTLSTDVECIRKLADLSNVIPLVAKADTLTPEAILALKEAYRQQAQDVGTKPFFFSSNSPFGVDNAAPKPPYAVSSEKTTDLEVMDASTLMSPDYEQPLVPSELGVLVSSMFDRDNLAWLRHSAAKKLIQGRPDFGPGSSPASPRDTHQHEHVLSGVSSPSSGWRSPPGTSLNASVCSLGDPIPTYTLARLADYTRHEERIAQVRLAQWATDLQRSLQNERERYAALARGDRAVWLTERLNECVIDGSLVPVGQTATDVHRGAMKETRSRGGNSHQKYRMAGLSAHDPLGVVSWIDDLGRRGWILVQIVGSVGVVGGLALWAARSWGFPSKSLAELHLDHWYGSMEQ